MKNEIGDLKVVVNSKKAKMEQESTVEMYKNALKKVNIMDFPLYSKIPSEFRKTILENNEEEKLVSIMMMNYKLDKLMAQFNEKKVEVKEESINEIRVIHFREGNTQSFVYTLMNEEKEKLTFRDLLEIVASLWNIKKGAKSKFVFSTSNRFMYPSDDKIYPHCLFLRKENKPLEFNLMSIDMLLDKFVGKQKAESTSETKTDLNEDKEEEGYKPFFLNEIEEYADTFSKLESLKIWRYFMRTEEVAKHAEKMALTDKETQEVEKEIQRLEEEDDDDNEAELAQLNAKLEDLQDQADNEKHEMRRLRKKKKPIYMSTKSIFWLRIKKTFQLILNFLLMFAVLSIVNSDMTIEYTKFYEVRKFLGDTIFQNKRLEGLGQVGEEEKMLTFGEAQLFIEITLLNLLFKVDTGNTIYPLSPFYSKDSSYFIADFVKIRFNKSTLVKDSSDNLFPYAQNNAEEQEKKANTQVTSPVKIDIEALDPTLKQYIKENELNFCTNCYTNNGLIRFKKGDPQEVSFTGRFNTYAPDGYIFLIDPLKVEGNLFKRIFDNLLKEYFMRDRQTRLMTISFNIIHRKLKILTNVVIYFEIGLSGEILTSSTIKLIPADKEVFASSTVNNVLSQIVLVYMLIGIVAELFFKLTTTGNNSIGTLKISVDSVIALLLTQIRVQDILFRESIATKFDNRYTEHVHSAEPLEIKSLTDDLMSIYKFKAFLIFLIVLRIVFYISKSIQINFVIKLVVRIVFNIFNTFVILCITTFSFALMLHILYGSDHTIYSTLISSLITVIFMLSGSFDSTVLDKSSFNTFQPLLITFYMVVIKFILFTFIYSVINLTFWEVKSKYKEFKNNDKNTISQDNIFIFAKYIFSLFFLAIRDWIHFRRLYRGVNIEKAVKEGDEGYNYEVIKYSGRSIYFLYPIKK